ncbi:EC7 protein [Colletotrichum higginsianum IMI 349063]|uniref:EC7 protein n=2 Tax=Colletotrichum higginsianum TaxID=80884 RepID=A0A1B7XR17_COLHI|nr:EC7 protein [Colletotrichum higginsianum IMI 349063]XP_018150726.1 EC7 protein [Colletotrichum higginsianum IMI 349063]OBR02082.1 EC7 protein [Colletotrichum higginsianum IMI 349063]OBR02208.1 EC7 protein [Colletotrichum higginsianum IMI 349063]
MPSSNFASFPLVARHCAQPTNCGAVVQGTMCDFCCASNVKPDSIHCKSRNVACQSGGQPGGQTFNCDHA